MVSYFWPFRCAVVPVLLEDDEGSDLKCESKFPLDWSKENIRILIAANSI
jgi:hypothetical protein